MKWSDMEWCVVDVMNVFVAVNPTPQKTDCNRMCTLTALICYDALTLSNVTVILIYINCLTASGTSGFEIRYDDSP